MGKWDKHISFMEHLVHNWEWTEAERAALFKAPSVAYYASNVGIFGVVKPEQFFEEHGEWLPQIEHAMKMVEAEQHTAAVTQAEGQKLRETVAASQAQIAALEAKLAALSAPAPLADAPNQVAETATEASVAVRQAAGMDKPVAADTPDPVPDTVTCPSCGNKFTP